MLASRAGGQYASPVAGRAALVTGVIERHCNGPSFGVPFWLAQVGALFAAVPFGDSKSDLEPNPALLRAKDLQPCAGECS